LSSTKVKSISLKYFSSFITDSLAARSNLTAEVSINLSYFSQAARTFALGLNLLFFPNILFFTSITRCSHSYTEKGDL
jgi:hypothetical protein